MRARWTTITAVSVGLAAAACGAAVAEEWRRPKTAASAAEAPLTPTADDPLRGQDTTGGGEAVPAQLLHDGGSPFGPIIMDAGTGAIPLALPDAGTPPPVTFPDAGGPF
jgi:hypothetical protein